MLRSIPTVVPQCATRIRTPSYYNGHRKHLRRSLEFALMDPLSEDHRHLYDLLGMLPGPADINFWKKVGAANGVPSNYIYEKMSLMALYTDRALRQPDKTGLGLGDFAKYVIMFFGGDKPALWNALSSM